MRKTFAQIRKDGGIHGVEAQIATVEDVFDLQGMGKVKDDEKRFLVTLTGRGASQISAGLTAARSRRDLRADGVRARNGDLSQCGSCTIQGDAIEIVFTTVMSERRSASASTARCPEERP